jgi:hypothetical protein
LHIAVVTEILTCGFSGLGGGGRDADLGKFWCVFCVLGRVLKLTLARTDV